MFRHISGRLYKMFYKSFHYWVSFLFLVCLFICLAAPATCVSFRARDQTLPTAVTTPHPQPTESPTNSTIRILNIEPVIMNYLFLKKVLSSMTKKYYLKKKSFDSLTRYPLRQGILVIFDILPLVNGAQD